MSEVSASAHTALQTDFDVVISGGGMAGSTLAWALTQALPALRIAIIEQQAAPVSQASFDSRSIALAAASVEALRRWQLWPALQHDACAIETIAVSDRGHFGKTRLTAAEYQLSALGYVLEVEYLGAVLSQKLAQCRNVQRIAPGSISAITPAVHQQQLTLADGQQLHCRLLVIAEGGNSPSRQLAGFAMQSQPYAQHAVIANLALAQPHQFTAFERFTEHGPIALLPLTAKRYSLVYTTTPQRASELMQLTNDAFLQQVQQAFGYRAGIFTAAGSRASYPLSSKRCPEVVAHRIALLGNSLHSVHPIAGQGFNLAVRDIEQLVACAVAAADIGDYAMLRAYKAGREADIQRVTTATDALVRIFSNRSRAMALLRNTGLLAMTLCDELKRPLALQAMGFRR